MDSISNGVIIRSAQSYSVGKFIDDVLYLNLPGTG